ncbi:MAG: aromatic amino acid ammonia-lyase, partial [Bdellovibrionales bacterium]|nr:aromatic amino acid ammonia-lyase [Bdellovibrionales bacterium]
MLKINGYDITMNCVWDVAYKNQKVEIADSAKEKIIESREYIEGRVKNGDVIYGVNTGFGAFSDVKISEEELIQLQKNLIRSHCVGVGEPFTKEQTRAIMLLRANALVRGHSGIRVEVIEKILEFLNNDLIPVIPQQGSVGASGDLAPLSHLALALIGEGKVWGSDDKPVHVSEVLKQKNIEHLEL